MLRYKVSLFSLPLLLTLLWVAPLSAQQSIFTTQTPQSSGKNNQSREYGTVFASSISGQITALRYWKTSSDSGTHTGRLWRVSDQALLATVTFSSSSTTGWQTQSLSAPVSITAGTQYLVTVSTQRYYGYTSNGLGSVITNGYLSTIVGNNGLYGTTIGAYPTQTNKQTNYFRDVVFVPSGGTGGGTPTINVTPDTVTLNFGQQQQFSAALGGGASGPVTWSATCGAINSSGLYTAPASGTSCGVTGQVTGASDTSTVALNQPPPPPATNTTTYYYDFREPEWHINNRTADTTNNEIACYRPEQVSMTSGLVITAIYQTNTCSSGISPSQQWPYTSGQIMWNSRSFLYGTLEFRAKFPTGQGTWPAVWMHGVVCQEYFKNWDGTCGWPTPPADEIDVAEVASGLFPGTVNQQIHSGSHNDGCRPTVTLNQYHTYQFIWQPGSLTWKIDGNTTCTVTGSYVPSNPMFLIINVAVGGIGGGTPNPSVFPQSLFVDYIKITP